MWKGCTFKLWVSEKGCTLLLNVYMTVNPHLFQMKSTQWHNWYHSKQVIAVNILGWLCDSMFTFGYILGGVYNYMKHLIANISAKLVLSTKSLWSKRNIVVLSICLPFWYTHCSYSTNIIDKFNYFLLKQELFQVE